MTGVCVDANDGGVFCDVVAVGAVVDDATWVNIARPPNLCLRNSTR